MMTSAWVLIAAILLLGGLLAALGDRLGSKFGKARLRIFNLRPRQTALLVTVFTGVLIAASTLGILFATSESLRKGVFRLDEILNKRQDAREALAKATKQKREVTEELSQAQTALIQAQERLERVNQNFKKTKAQLKQASQKVNNLQQKIETLQTQAQSLQAERKQLREQRNRLAQKIQQLDQELAQRNQTIAQREQKIAQQEEKLQDRKRRLQQLQQQKKALQEEINQRDKKIAQLDQTIAKRDRTLQARKVRLKELEKQLSLLRGEVAQLEQNYQKLRQGNVALVRGQVLAFGVVRITNPSAANQAVDQLLREANQTVLEVTRPRNGTKKEQIIQITNAQVKRLIEKIDDGQAYVVEILSAGNYVRGEKKVRVFADAAQNQKVFNRGEVIAAVSVQPSKTTRERLQERMDLLLAASQFRARRAGVLGPIEVEGGNVALIRFMERLNQSQGQFDQIRTVAFRKSDTEGPLQLLLVAMQDGEVVFVSGSAQRIAR